MQDEYYLEPKQIGEGGLPFSFNIQNSSYLGFSAKAHVQEYIEVLYCHKGRHRVMLNGIESDFYPGDLVIINPHTIHSVQSYGDKGSCYSVIKFDTNFLCSVAGSAAEWKYLLPFRVSGTPNQTLFRAAELSPTIIPSVCNEIREEYTKKAYGYEFALKIQAQRLLLWVLRKWGQGTLLPVGKQAKKLDEILDYLWKHYDQKLQGTQVAGRFYISYSHLSGLIRSATGLSFVKYLNYIRITQAKKLLIATDAPVTEIALDTGFSSSSYFIEQFREFEGVSPGQFRSHLSLGKER